MQNKNRSFSSAPGGSHSGGYSRASSGGGSGGGPQDQGEDDPKIILKSNERVRYRDEHGNLRKDLLDAEAQEAAQELGKITTTQLRRFFEQVTAIKRRLELNSDISDGEILSQVAFLKAAGAYAVARHKDNATLKENAPLLKFLVKNANSIEKRQHFHDFQRHFETVIAFHKVFSERRTID